MRRVGKVIDWNDDRGFGFIAPRGGGRQIFVHVQDFTNARVRPSGGETVTYEQGVDERNRRKAIHVVIVSQQEFEMPGKVKRAPGFAILFLAGICVWTFLSEESFWGPVYYVGISIFTYLMYGLDKWRAENQVWRTPESFLHILALAGGWPGAMFGQRFLRHKVSKASFMTVFWLTVLINIVAYILIFTPVGEMMSDPFL